MKEIIRINNLTKDYGAKKGVFDVNLSINKGEVFGIVGISGSGKTTIIRHLMGFLKPDKGKTFIQNQDSWNNAANLKNIIGYVPGEIAFPDAKNGAEFLNLQARFLRLRDMSYADDLIKRFNLDTSANLKRMSKGMKQKTAIVDAFMADPEILLLDEATTGFDPLMQNVFVDLIKQEKSKGKTIFMSSHMFSELESTCDRVAFLKNGHIIQIVDVKEIRGNEKTKKYKIKFVKKEDYKEFLRYPFNMIRLQENLNQVTVQITDEKINDMFQVLSHMEVKFISQIPLTLETYFKEKYNQTEVA
ncbi:ABC transporter ATP-binding protein [Oenococcus oeni]|uniref:ABC transporter ATP-binding protein n=2 Tax=Oenococcus oeni TaxID=1247 RepID=UPI0008F8D8CC|nr:ABC transporter ATP-binding protein [Oenococcus oeni]OIK62153.1 ABC transporter ATP-binding protein [Oenococcus oeni]OIK89256.1 ABC transporter ATP-binding protein [Oenococcus oeni]OIL85430.1 ABC transporter ATP-binding protein [Oenococcus oeni]OIM71859.1 ABC transporter ATP-binding protein [Oenococcus oeni]OLQ31841.1 ABC transporter ATP-binding protein [Oenococcus oeni]